eukprot:CAMPEP_0175065270 /NCGR_PEP_ID=MMETSP0052_2-20121109/15824_1 /TAXON_ID=51329 ORGANISM="Polytomella parva, Strain SAG 63-3" /NCGR_SAMPLE_ID=MMETSP0052_2 /ASSEMBLY_ACC=CAM_ASM_000194 /LENGTH=343 /DNA_ID=CAMNT_0016331771 /DNA_START=49 /DNA_END=1077 /DNA_ORIENTATION=-
MTDDKGVDVIPQAVEILESLSNLGISESLRNRVHLALNDLTNATCENSNNSNSNSKNVGVASSSSSKKSSSSNPKQESDLTSQVKSLEQKLGLSRSIMKKLYHKNVLLEKEIQLFKANSEDSILNYDALLRPLTSQGSFDRSNDPSLLKTILLEREMTVRQLQQALAASRRRCTLLEFQIQNSSSSDASSSSPFPGLSAAPLPGSANTAMKDVVAQATLHLAKYNQIREEYNKYLKQRSGVILNSNRKAKASSEAQEVVRRLQSRLSAEREEREAEAALYSARLYESERASSEWFVERRRLEEVANKLREELEARDRLDAEMEECVGMLFARLKAAEAEAAAA